MNLREKIAAQDARELDSRFDHFEYYRFSSDLPVRIWISKEGGEYAAQWPGSEKGTLEIKNSFLTKGFKYDDEELIPVDEDEFYRLLENYVHRPVMSLQDYLNSLTEEERNKLMNG